MKSITKYKEEIIELCDELGIVGDHVELLATVTAYGLVNSDLNLINKTKELSLTASNFLSSKIQFGMDRNYSVFRGINPILRLTFNSNLNVTYNVHDLVFESNDYCFYSLENKSFNIDLNKINSLLVYVTPVRNSTHKLTGNDGYYLEVPSDDWSSFYSCKVNGVQVPTTRMFRDHILNNYSDGESTYPTLFDLTTQSFGFRLYNNNKFELTDEIELITYKYYSDIPKLEKTIGTLDNTTPQARISIKGFRNLVIKYHTGSLYDILNDLNSLVKSSYKPDANKFLPRESEYEIEYNAMSALNTNSILRSNSDVTDLFISLYPTIVKDTRFKYVNGQLTLYYVTYESMTLDNSQLEYYRNELNRAYYINANNIVFKKATEIIINITINIYSYLDRSEIEEDDILFELGLFERTLGVTLSKDILRSNLAKIPNVSYVTLTLDYEPEIVDPNLASHQGYLTHNNSLVAIDGVNITNLDDILEEGDIDLNEDDGLISVPDTSYIKFNPTIIIRSDENTNKQKLNRHRAVQRLSEVSGGVVPSGG